VQYATQTHIITWDPFLEAYIALAKKLSLKKNELEKVNEDLFLDKPLHVIQNHSKLAYRI
jgi:hypothetical protein